MKSCEEMYKEVQPLFEADDPEGAINALKKILQTYPDFAQANYDLGALHFEKGTKEKALEYYRESVNLDPGNATYLKTLGDFYYTELGSTGDAKKLYQQVIEVTPKNVETLLMLGNLAVVEHDFDGAKGFYQRVLDIEPWNHDALTIFEKLEQRDIHGDNEQSPESTYEYSQELVQTGKIEAAIAELEKLLVDNPDFARAHNDLGVLYYQNGSKDKTLMHYEEAVRLEPDDLNFQKNLADFYCVEQGRIEDALEIYLKVLKEEPTDIETLMAAGYICKAYNRIDDAQVFFERILDLEPWNLEANDNLNQIKPGQLDVL
jgi:tetratricopeptide (TPR) repeat protein